MKEPLPIKWVQKIFMMFTGRFGNQFIDKYKSGQTTNDNQDTGVSNALDVWSTELAGIQPEQLTIGLNAIYDYPPSCDEFKKACLKKEVIHPSHFPMLPGPEIPLDKEKAKEFSQAVKKLSEFKGGAKHWVRIMKSHSLGILYPDIAIKYAQEALIALNVDYKSYKL